MKDQLQELDATILQRRQYLQAQDNQIQRNLSLLKQQQSQLKQNKAVLERETKKLSTLSSERKKVLETLREQAEKEPSARYVRLSKDCDIVENQIKKLSHDRRVLEKIVVDSEDYLSKLDMDIIEADAIHNDLLEQIKVTRAKLRKTEESASFQASISAQLTYDIEKMDKQIEGAKNYKTSLEKDQQAISKEVEARNRELTDLKNLIEDKTIELATLNQGLQEKSRSLKQLTDKDNNFRRNLADEKLTMAREKENIKVSKQALKKEVEARQQLNPKFKLKTTDEPQHFKI